MLIMINALILISFTLVTVLEIIRSPHFFPYIGYYICYLQLFLQQKHKKAELYKLGFRY